MVIDWVCNQCGTQGAAVALKRGEELHRVRISHRYASAAAKSRHRRQNQCHGIGIRWAPRTILEGSR